MKKSSEQKVFELALQNTLTPLLAGIRNDLQERGLGMLFSLSPESIELLKSVKGEDGYTPTKGKDYFTDEEITSLLRIVTPVKGKHYFTKTETKEFKDAILKMVFARVKDGYTPKKGKDYFTKAEIKDFIEAVTPVKDVDYFDGKPGAKGADGNKLTLGQLINIIGRGGLPISAIKGLAEALDALANAVARKDGGNSLGGSGSTTINNGGTSQSGARFQAPTESANSVITVFTFPGIANKPNAIVVNQLWYFETDAWTWNAGTSQATLLIAAPDTGSTIRASY